MSANFYGKINGITKAKNSTLQYYGKGQVTFDNSVPSTFRIPFAISGSGENLSKYNIRVKISETEPCVELSITRVHSKLEKIIGKIFRIKPETKLLSMPILGENLDGTACDLVKFLRKDLATFIPTCNLPKTIGKHIFRAILH